MKGIWPFHPTPLPKQITLAVQSVGTLPISAEGLARGWTQMWRQSNLHPVHGAFGEWHFKQSMFAGPKCCQVRPGLAFPTKSHCINTKQSYFSPLSIATCHHLEKCMGVLNVCSHTERCVAWTTMATQNCTR